MRVEKYRKNPSLPCEKRITKTQESERTNVVITHYVMNFNDLWDNKLT